MVVGALLATAVASTRVQHGRASAQPPPPSAACAAQLDGWCARSDNKQGQMAECLSTLKKQNSTLPMVAAFTTNKGESPACVCVPPRPPSFRHTQLIGLECAEEQARVWRGAATRRTISPRSPPLWPASTTALPQVCVRAYTRTHTLSLSCASLSLSLTHHPPSPSLHPHAHTAGPGTHCEDACSGAGPYLEALLRKCDPGWAPPPPPPPAPCPAGERTTLYRLALAHSSSVQCCQH
eukprot:COSAG03_NODE_2187_length_3031_cov_27.906207_2_plen_237_part_00